MAINKNSVSFIKDYLAFAVEFEKYVYIWQNAMNEANGQMERLYQQKRQLLSTQNTLGNSPANSETMQEMQRIRHIEDAKKYQRKAITSLIVCLVDFLLCLVVGFSMANQMSLSGGSEAEGISPVIIAIFMTVVIFLATMVGPISFGKYLSNKSKSEKSFTAASASDNRRRAVLLQARQAENATGLANVTKQETGLQQWQGQIFQQLQAAQKNLSELYSQNVLPMKYRTFSAVTTLYEYLETGRCNTIQGHGGIYDTYEHDLQMGLIIETLTEIRDSMYRIEANQQLLYRELQQANRTLSSINSSLREIEKTNAQIAQNTAISAAANQQTAAATKWMAWNAWVNGY